MKCVKVFTVYLLLSVFLGITNVANAEEAIHLGVGPHLFVDDYLIAGQEGVQRVVTPPERLAKPVVTGPEDKCFQPYVTVLRDIKTNRFRIWYGIPESASQSHVAYMESEDSVHWIRPHRVLKDPSPIQFGVSIIDDGPDFSDASKRYKYGYWFDGGLRIAVSPDGLDWTSISLDVLVKHNHDITAIARDPIRGRYIALVSTYNTGEWTGQRRIPMQSVSQDCLHWSEPQVIITPDEKDEGETQFYCMAGVIARGDLLIGLLKVLRDELKVEEAPEGAYGLGYTCLAWTRDGKTWNRDRVPFMDRNPVVGSWDHAMTWGDCQLIAGKETYIYYGGYKWGHKFERFTERQIGLAKMPVDRYVARRAGDQEGRIVTPSVLIDGPAMTVNADIKGSLSIRFTDQNGTAMKGFDWSDCKVAAGNSVDLPVEWSKPLAELKSTPVKIEIKMQSTDLYALQVRNGEKG